MRHWTQQERARQAQLIRKWQPWKKAGVKSPGGKAASSMNALKHGAYGYETRLMRRYLALAKAQTAYARKWQKQQKTATRNGCTAPQTPPVIEERISINRWKQGHMLLSGELIKGATFIIDSLIKRSYH